MNNKESRRYKHDIKRQGDLATRPVEMFKKNDDNTTSLVFKSRNVDYNELKMTKNGLELLNPFYNNDVYHVEQSPTTVLDFSKSNIQKITLVDDLYVSDIINYQEGVEYYLIIEQVSGNKEIAWGSNIPIYFKDYELPSLPQEKIFFKLVIINDKIYVISIVTN